MTAPTLEQLEHLVGHADHRPLTPVEAEALRTGLRHLVERTAHLAAAEATLDRRTRRARTAEVRLALALAAVDGHVPQSDEARQLAHEVRSALTMPDPDTGSDQP